jgi:exodeoxyribonuclease-3
VQEIKAQAPTWPGASNSSRACRALPLAEKKGYSGVGVYSRHEPSEVVIGFGAPEFDAEGRYVELRFDTPTRRFSVISSYFPSGSSGEERQQAKFRFLDLMHPHLMALKQQREFVLCGDINIAHKEADLKNWKGNQKNSGFLPERAWMSRLLADDAASGGLVDVYRRLQPDTTEACYTWWSNRGQAYAKNVGWRLDYHLATPAIAETARSEAIYKGEKFSDHAPITIEYALTL